MQYFFCSARGNVEDWLGKVEEAMVVNLRKMSKAAMVDFMQRTREEWCVAHPSQVKDSLLDIDFDRGFQIRWLGYC